MRFGKLKRIHKANAFKWFIASCRFKMLMLDVHRSDVVRQQHDFIAMQFVLVLVFERGSFNLLHHPHDEISRANEGIKDMNITAAKRLAELFLQDVLDASHHEINNRLWRVDDAMRICDLYGKALKELLINRIQEVLFLRVAINS